MLVNIERPHLVVHHLREITLLQGHISFELLPTKFVNFKIFRVCFIFAFLNLTLGILRIVLNRVWLHIYSLEIKLSITLSIKGLLARMI